MENKKRESLFLFMGVYGRFLSNSSARRTPTKAIATITPAMAGMKYWSAMDAGSGVGAAVATGASSTVTNVVADDGA